MFTKSTMILLMLCAACGKAAKSGGGSSAVSPAADVDHANATGNGAAPRDLVLTWDARKGAAAESFNIYGQLSAKDAEVPLLRLSAGPAFDAANPTATLHTTDIALAPFLGKTVCLSVTAVVGGRESAPSSFSCVQL